MGPYQAKDLLILDLPLQPIHPLEMEGLNRHEIFLKTRHVRCTAMTIAVKVAMKRQYLCPILIESFDYLPFSQLFLRFSDHCEIWSYNRYLAENPQSRRLHV